MSKDCPLSVVDSLVNGFWCAFYNARNDKQKITALLESVWNFDDTYIADIIIEEELITLEVYSFLEEPPQDLLKLCDWLSDSNTAPLKMELSFFVYKEI